LKVIIVDDTLVSWAGHSAEYDFAILNELAKRQIECQIFGQKNISQFKDWAAKVKAAFRHTSGKVLFQGKILPRFIFKIKGVCFTNFSHLFDLLRRVTACVKNNDLLLICDFSSRTSLAYALWLFYLSALRRRLGVVIMVHGVPRYYGSWRLLKLLGRLHRLTLAALNQPVADLCAKQTSLECLVFPIPQTRLLPDSSGCEKISTGQVALAYLGVAIVEKGFDVLVDEISLLQDMFTAKRITLTIQCNIISASPILEAARDKLLSLVKSIAGLKIIEGELPEEEFFNVLNAADILLFPYQPEVYKYIQSAIFTQALTLGKVAICTAGSLAAGELQKYGSGLIYEYGVNGSLAKTIRQAVSNFEAMQEEAKIKRPLYYQIHNPRRYVDLLLGQRILV